MSMEQTDLDENSAFPKNIVPLRTILRNFLKLVDNYENRHNGDIDLYDQEFQELKQFSEGLKSDSYYQSKEGERSINRKKNRYKDILPFDYSRVTLSDVGDIPGSDYVNANFIRGASGSLAYIACQGPLPHTVNDFWRMVVESEVQVIVMACMEQESGKHKCENYWVEEDGVEREFGEVTVWLKKCRTVCSDFLVRTMRIRFPNRNGELEERNVCQFHYSAWPDHGVPTKVRPLLDMVRLIRDCQTSETLPVLVHCSAGCGRTGTICAIDYVWGLLRLGKLTEDFSLFHLVREMRRQRIAMVQTKDQYILVHRAVKELFQEQLKIIDAHPYANVDQDGLPVEIRQELEEPTYATIDYQCKGPTPPRPPSPVKRKIEPLTENNNLKQKTSMKIPVWKGKREIESSSKTSGHTAYDSVSKSNAIVEGKPKLKLEEEFSRRYVNEVRGEDTVDCSSSSSGSKVSPPSVSPSRAAFILRKPSIGKLKAFFEKTPKELTKKANVTINGLSRAKSDVTASSRLYSFAASLSGSKGSSGVLSNSKKKELKHEDLERPTVTEFRTNQCKPPVLVKTAAAVQRSKSLKIHPEESPVNKNLVGNGISHQNPIKVCVRQTEIPTLQRVSSTSSKHVENDYELLKPNVEQSSRRGSLEQFKHELQSTHTKPLLPLKTQTFPETSQMKEKTKPLENVMSKPQRSKDIIKAKETDSITPMSAILVGSVMASGCLTRSHSHVWQPTNGDPSLRTRIFPNESTHKSETELKSGCSDQEQTKPQADVSLLKNDLKNATLSPLLDNPVARRRLPKVAAYTNCPVELDSGPCFGKKDLGLLAKINAPFGTMSVLSGTQYTSDSSNSLPSTPSQSIDRRISQNGRQDSPQLLNPQLTNPTTMLKGSLSSTPSDSDELLDMNRPNFSGTTVVTISNNNPVTVNNVVNRNHLPMGMRERRNSFRQAVWKEVQNDTEQNYQGITPSPQPYATSKLLTKESHRDEPLISSHRTHKDYEPIWPSHANGHSSSTSPQPTYDSGTSFADTSNQSVHRNSPFAGSSQTVKNRISEFNGLLDELKTPYRPFPTTVDPSSDINFKTNPETKKSPSLKYHRSLKAPSRSEYEQSHSPHALAGMSTLSCFTFKKPTSLESICDQFHTEDRTGKKSVFSFRSKEQNGGQGSASSSTSHGFHSGRYANDYVTLEQCRTDDGSCGFRVEGEDEVDMRSPKGHIYHNSTNSGELPIPPPRTKGKKSNPQLESSGESDLKNSDGSTVHNGSRSGSGIKPPNGEGSYRRRMKSGDSTNTASPLSTRNRALGIFQDMKTKFANWTEPSSGKERSQSQGSGSSGFQSKRGSEESSGSNSSGSRDPTLPPRGGGLGDNHGTSNLSLNGKQASSRSTSKHQYL